jgi:hypothetical protein
MTAITQSDFGAAPFRFGRLALIIAAIVALNYAGGWMVAQLNFQIWPRHSDMIDMIIVAVIVAYILTMMLPFVPGIEIGLALMLFLGSGGVVLVYLCTQVALALSFAIGRFVPMRSVVPVLRALNLERASRMLLELEKVDPAQRVKYLLNRAPRSWVSALLRNRYLALAVVINLPGNAAIGGAGGIGAIAGMSRLFRFRHYLLVVLIATTPVPVFLLLTGGA